MGGQEMQLLEGVVSSQYVWAILCLVIGVTYYRMMKTNATKMEEKSEKKEAELQNFYAEQREESKEREMSLMNHLERSNDSQEKIVDSLERIENRMNKGFSEVWTHLGEIDKRDKGE